MNKFKIRSDILKQLREKFNLTQAQLGEKARVSQKTISNLETGHENKKIHTANMRTTNFLAKTLMSEKSELSGEKPISKKPKSKEVSIRLSPKVELNYDLVAKNYGITKQDIFDVAPLLFFVAAERSLDKQISDLELELEKLRELAIQTENEVEQETVDDLESRYYAHANKDIFEKSHISEIAMAGGFKNNPFTNFLGKEVSNPRFKSEIDFSDEYGWLFHGYVHYTFNDQIPDYQVCKGLLSELTLNSKIAKNALQSGEIKITDIPNELFGDGKAMDRVNWIEREYQSKKNLSDKNE